MGNKNVGVEIFEFKYSDSNMVGSNIVRSNIVQKDQKKWNYFYILIQIWFLHQILHNEDPFENFGYNPNAGRSSSLLSLPSPRGNNNRKVMLLA